MNGIVRKILHKSCRAFQLGWQLIHVIQQFRLLQGIPKPRFAVRWKDRWLHLRDATATTGFDRHYVFHTAWATRVLAETRPVQHVDVASSLYFVSSISAFIPTRFIDYRPAELNLSGLSCEAGTLMALPFGSGTLPSLSCMHVIEHVGLGRYGDPFDYDGDLKAVAELVRVLAPGGHLLLVVPIGGEARIQFNAHRIYTYQQVLDMVPGLEIREFALIPDDGAKEGLIRHADPAVCTLQLYGCGCFHFIKRTPV